jgi:hypothetical protein
MKVILVPIPQARKRRVGMEDRTALSDVVHSQVVSIVRLLGSEPVAVLKELPLHGAHDQLAHVERIESQTVISARTAFSDEERSR